MKKKTLQFLMGITMTATLFAGAVPAMAEESLAVETELTTEAITEQSGIEVTDTAEEATEAVAEEETETEASDFIEGSALLSDYDYKAGELTEESWKSEFLDMQYEPGDSITMDVEDNEKLKEYHLRNGEDKQISNNEMIAKDEDDGYVQIMVIVNPNDESEEDVLGRFAEEESLELVSKAKEMEIAGKTFSTCTGIKDKERFLVGVSTDMDNLAIAIKVKYKNSDARDIILDGFSTISAPETEEEETEAETEPASEAVSEGDETEAETEEGVTRRPSNFDISEIITEARTEAESH